MRGANFTFSGQVKRSELKVVAVSSPGIAQQRILVDSLLDHGARLEDVLIATLHEPWSWHARMRVWADVLRRLVPEQLVLFVDASDVLVVGSPDRIVASYSAFDPAIVYSSVDYIWPRTCPFDIRRDTCANLGRNRRFASPGVFIGRSAVLLERVFSREDWRIADPATFDDQCYAQFMVDEGVGRIDDNDTIFVTTAAKKWEAFSKPRGRPLTYTTAAGSTMPCVLHYDSYHPSFDALAHDYSQLHPNATLSGATSVHYNTIMPSYDWINVVFHRHCCADPLTCPMALNLMTATYVLLYACAFGAVYFACCGVRKVRRQMSRKKQILLVTRTDDDL